MRYGYFKKSDNEIVKKCGFDSDDLPTKDGLNFTVCDFGTFKNIEIEPSETEKNERLIDKQIKDNNRAKAVDDLKAIGKLPSNYE